MKGLLFLATALLLMGCESDEKKFERLQTELDAAQRPLRIADRAASEGKPQCPELVNMPTDKYLSVCTERLQMAQAKAAVAQREMNKFMAGR